MLNKGHFEESHYQHGALDRCLFPQSPISLLVRGACVSRCPGLCLMNLMKEDCQGYRASCLTPQIIGNPVKRLALLPKASSSKSFSSQKLLPDSPKYVKTLNFPLKTSHGFSEL